MTSRALAWRTVASQPARAALAITGVAVIGALLFDMLLLSQGLLVSFRTMLETTGYDVRVASSDGFPIRVAMVHASEVAEAVMRLPEVRAATVVRTDRAMVLLPRHQAVDVALLNLTGSDAQHAWRIVEGRDLDSPSHQGEEELSLPAVISRPLAKALGLGLGSTLPLRAFVWGTASALPTLTFTVVGVAEFQFELGDSDIVATTIEAYRQAQARVATDEADMILVTSQPNTDPSATVAAIERARPEVRAFSNEQLVARFNENGFAYFRQISFVLTTITLGFACLLVATLLTVSVNQRLGQVAALRALGVPRRRIAATLIWESALLVGAGGLLSLPVGWGLALQLDRILREMPNLPDRLHFFVFEPSLAAWHLALLAATGVAAAVYPVWVATRLPIAATLRFETIS
jgi:putative ABC transport system permease protein